MGKAWLDMLDVDGTSVVWHIMPLIQCIPGCEQLARKSQPCYLALPLPLSLSHSSNPLNFTPLRREQTCTHGFVLINICRCRPRYKCHYFRITGDESSSSVNREPWSSPISLPDRTCVPLDSEHDESSTPRITDSSATEQMMYRHFHFTPVPP